MILKKKGKSASLPEFRLSIQLLPAEDSCYSPVSYYG